MSFDLVEQIRIVNTHSNIDILYGVYPSKEEALEAVVPALRQLGRTVGIIEDDKVVEYWFESSVEDDGLITKVLSPVSNLIGEYGIDVDDANPLLIKLSLSSAVLSSLLLADSSIQIEDLSVVAISGSYNDLNNLPTLLGLGETASTAYRGDRGKIAYDYSLIGHIVLSEKGNINGVATLDENGKVPLEQLPTIETNAVSYNEQTPTLEQQAQARENVGVTESSYYQRFDWNSTTNPTKEFLLDFIPKNINYVVNTNTFLWMDDSDYEIVGTTLRILTTNIANGAIIRINYTHE